jgi:hypothetical protein
MKTCSKCKKSLENFYFTPGTKNRCVMCCRKASKAATVRRREENAGIDKVWHRSLIVSPEQYRNHTI